MTPWESCALQTEALRANLRRHNRDSQGLTADMKRNHDFSSSDSELEETIEVEKESADENGYVIDPLYARQRPYKITQRKCPLRDFFEGT